MFGTDEELKIFRRSYSGYVAKGKIGGYKEMRKRGKSFREKRVYVGGIVLVDEGSECAEEMTGFIGLSLLCGLGLCIWSRYCSS